MATLRNQLRSEVRPSKQQIAELCVDLCNKVEPDFKSSKGKHFGNWLLSTLSTDMAKSIDRTGEVNQDVVAILSTPQVLHIEYKINI